MGDPAKADCIPPTSPVGGLGIRIDPKSSVVPDTVDPGEKRNIQTYFFNIVSLLLALLTNPNDMDIRRRWNCRVVHSSLTLQLRELPPTLRMLMPLLTYHTLLGTSETSCSRNPAVVHAGEMRRRRAIVAPRRGVLNSASASMAASSATTDSRMCASLAIGA